MTKNEAILKLEYEASMADLSIPRDKSKVAAYNHAIDIVKQIDDDPKQSSSPDPSVLRALAGKASWEDLGSWVDRMTTQDPNA